MNTLYLEKRGCNFFAGDPVCNESDVGNYRVTTPGYTVRGKNGRDYFIEICRGDRYNLRKTNKRTGKELKKPVWETIMKNAAFINACYVDDGGQCWKDNSVWKIAWNSPRKYTIANILALVNEFSAVQYDAVEFVYNVDRA